MTLHLDLSDSFLAVAQRLLSQPTAPFREDAVRAEILALLQDCPDVTTQQDSFGNLFAQYRLDTLGPPRLALAAHMDHPAYVKGEFLGGVPEAYRAASPPTVAYGDFAMWDLPAYDVREDRIHSRACDDLIGCAAMVTTLRYLALHRIPCALDAIFSRAEEVGFVGAVEAAKSGLIDPSTIVVSLETSSEKGGPIRMGDGVIIRVGDRTSIFDSASTSALLKIAQDNAVPHQRALMSGGTCEATAYQVYGYTTAAICVALGNYHNCGPDQKIQPEYVSIHDSVSMTALCVEAARAQVWPDVRGALKSKYDGYLAEYRRFHES